MLSTNIFIKRFILLETCIIAVWVFSTENTQQIIIMVFTEHLYGYTGWKKQHKTNYMNTINIKINYYPKPDILVEDSLVGTELVHRWKKKINN